MLAFRGKTSQPSPRPPITKDCRARDLKNKTKGQEKGGKRVARGGEREAENSLAVGVCMHQHHNDESSQNQTCKYMDGWMNGGRDVCGGRRKTPYHEGIK